MPPDLGLGSPPPRGELSRADLLRVLACAPHGQAGALAGLLGWRHDPLADASERSGAGASTATASTASPADTPVRYLARPAPRYWRVLGCEPVEQAGPDEDDAGRELAPPDTGPPPPQDQPSAPLLNAGQWQNLWDRLPPSSRRGRRVDVRASIRRLARAEPLRRLPRLSRRGFNRSVTLILDRPQALRPIWDDMRRAKQTLQTLLGGELPGVHLPAGPDGPWLPLGSAAYRPEGHGPALIPDGALVVLIGAFGALHSAEIAPDWRRLLTRLRANGCTLLLVPVCPLRQTALPTAPLDPALTRAEPGGAGQGLDLLLDALSQVWLPTPARLRALRLAVPGADLHTELLAYDHPQVWRDHFHLGLRPEQQLARAQRFQGLPAADRAPIEAAIQRWREQLDVGAADIERLQASLAAPAPIREQDYPQLVHQSNAAAASVKAGGGMALAQFCAMLPVIEQLREQRAGARCPTLYRNAAQVARAIGRPTRADQPGSGEDTASHSLHQQGTGLVVRPGRDGLLPIGPAAYSTETGQLVDGGPLHGLERLEIIDRGHRWRLAAESRPTWAERLWSDGKDLFAAHADGVVFTWLPATPGRAEGYWQPEHGADAWPWAAETGVDRFGLWTLLRIADADYRLRWLPPGRFLMGSPDEEPQREDNERQHPVRLTHGFWLGETAVTQALWQAVTSETPSRFKGPDLPVEQVSWDDCQGFIKRLAALAPGLRPALPTEAQWEYACRAGTRTPFSFGATLDTERANYDGNFPYHTGIKGAYRKKTLPVRSFQPNPWGLYQMHGNVFEWCADGFGDYPDGETTDPAGPEQGPGRVLRGGSWSGRGRSLRSAYRSHYAPDSRDGSFGLRLAGGVDPQASQSGQPGAGALTADGREQSERPIGGQGAGGAVREGGG